VVKLLTLTALGSAATVLWQRADAVLAGIYNRQRPSLERLVGQVMGHPLQLGPYQGLGPDGLRVGPSRFLAGPQDRSTVAVEQVRLLIDPFAWIQRRTLVLDLSFGGAQVDLRRNQRGQLWVLGKMAPGGEPPRLDLRFHLLQPAAVRLWNLAGGPGPITAAITGSTVVRTHEHALEVQALARLPAEPEAITVRGSGDWQRQQWRAELGVPPQRLAPLGPWLRLPGDLAGRASGRLELRLDRGGARCQGSLAVQQFQWRQRPGSTALEAEHLPLRCQGRQLALGSSPWRYGPWQGRLAARATIDQQLGMRWQLQAPPGHPLAPLPLAGELRGRWRQGGLELSQLQLSRGGARLEGQGRLGPRSSLQLAGRWRLRPEDIPPLRRLPPWVAVASLQGGWQLAGTLAAPRVLVRTDPATNRLLGPWWAEVAWRDQVLSLQRFISPPLRARARLPLALRPGRGLVVGELDARFQLRDYALARLNPLLGTRLEGHLDADGRLQGPLQRLKPTVLVEADRPGAGPLRLNEVWRGQLLGDVGWAGGLLQLQARNPAPPGRLQARFDRRWQPVRIDLERAGGHLHLAGSPRSYRWTARAIPLGSLALALGPKQRFQSLQGLLSGSGSLGLQPLTIAGEAEVEGPQLLGVAARRLQAQVRYADREYHLRGLVEPLAGGSLAGTWEGRWNGPFRAVFQARQLNAGGLRQLVDAGAIWRGAPPPSRGQAKDLAGLAIDTLAGSLEDQLRSLAAAQVALEERRGALARASRAERLARLQLGLEADLVLVGRDLAHAMVDLKARGHLWTAEEDRDRALTSAPLTLELEGPLWQGEGRFNLAGLSLVLINLLTPVPASLRGLLAINGRYRLGGGRPDLSLVLGLSEAYLGERPLRLERGAVDLRGEALQLDLALRAEGAFNSLDLAGSLPLNPHAPGLELRLASRGDGLVFLSRLAGQALDWQRGSADLQLLVRGSLDNPIANGFLRLRDGDCRFIGQTLHGLQATVLFDFQQLLVQDLRAQVGRQGLISGAGRLGLLRPLPEDPNAAVALRLQRVPFAMERIRAVSDGEVRLGGSLGALRLGGDLRISRGSINVTPGSVSRTQPGQGAPKPAGPPTSVNALLESKWTFDQPLLLLGPELSAETNASLRESIPNFPYLTFADLMLRLGPDLRVQLSNVARFNTAGQLRISGRLDPSLTASGVVRLLGGRLNLFTTTFNLDPDAPNVAVFTPTLGLVPYLDIALRTRISDTLGPIGGSDNDPATLQRLAESEARGSAPSATLNQLKLILVTLSISGPADRIAETFQLRSSPPLPQDRLLALIGGNSLAGLSGNGAGTALATVLGQQLLSPLLSGLSDAMGQRISFALYPTYVNPSIASQRELFSRRVPPQLVLGSEIGVDLTDRFNASVIAAPNRSDVPPQLNLNYKASETLNLEGSVDTQGSWQTQLRLFLRFRGF